MERVCTQTIKVPFPIKVFFNSEVTINLPRSGDGITKIQLVLDVPFTNTYQEKIVNYAELISDDTTIEKIYGEFMHIENQLITPIEKRGLLSNLLCSISPGTVYLELPFHAVKNRLFELENTKVRISFTSGDDSELQGYLLVDYIVTESRPKEPYFQKTRKISNLTFPTNQSTKYASVHTYIPGPVYEIIVTVQDTNTNEYVDAIEHMSMFIGENERFSLSGHYLMYVEPLKVYKRYSQSIPVYVYSFRLNYDTYVPSGHTNLTDKQKLFITFYDNETTYKVNIWAQSHDFFYKNKIVKGVFSSDELILSTSFQQVRNFQDLDFKTSYTFYLDSASITYTSNIEISNVNVVSTNAPDYAITQNEIIFTNVDSLNGDYYANVVFSAYGFRDVTCYFNFKSPTSMNEYINGTEIGFYDTLFSGSPKTVIDGDQRFNIYSGTTLNGVDLGGTDILNVVVDQKRNYIVSRSDSVIKYASDLSGPLYTVTGGGDYFGIPSSYNFGTDTIPSSNIIYFYTNNTLSSVKHIEYAFVQCSDGEYVSGNTIGTGPINFVDDGVTVDKGTGTKSFLAKYSPDYDFSIIIDESSGSTYVRKTSNGFVMSFPVTSSSTLFATDTEYEYNFNGCSIVRFDSNGRRMWSSNVSSSASPETCHVDIFDNSYFTYYIGSTDYYIRKIDLNGKTKWTKNFSDVSVFSMNTWVSQDVTYVSYTNNDASLQTITFGSTTKNIPPGLTEISAFDSNGNLIEPYVTPTSNVADFTNKPKDLYYTPLYNGVYFSNNSTYTYTDATRRYWGMFVLGFPSTSCKSSDSITDTVFTGQFGPISSNVYPSSVVLPEVDICSTFITKAYSNGNVNWSSYIDPVIFRYTGYSVYMSSTGDIYASGTFGKYRSNIYNSDGTMFDGYLPVLANSGAYLVKFDTDGIAQWQTYMDGVSGDDKNYSITGMHSNVYIAIQARFGTTVYNATLTGDRVPTSSGLSTTGARRSVVVKYNNTGQASWVVSFSSNNNFNRGSPYSVDIVTDSSENVLVTLNYTLGNGFMIQSNGTSFAPNLYGCCAVKMSQTGFGILAIRIDNSTELLGICVDPTDDSFIVCGRMDPYESGSNPVEFYEWNGSSIVNSGSSINPVRGDNTDAFIAKYNSSGDFQWSAYIVHDEFDTNACTPLSVVCDSAGNIYVSGWYKNTCTVYNSNGTAFSKVLPDTGSGFLIKYNQSGTCQWVVILDSNDTQMYPNISVDSNNNVIVCGSYYGKGAKFYDSNDGEHNSQQTITASQSMTYCVKYDTNGFLVPV